MKHLNIRVAGKVQGVFFRQSAIKEARRLGVAGFARNESDGTVYIEAEGSESALEEFRRWCQDGPSSAKVTDIEVRDGDLQNYTDFTAH